MAGLPGYKGKASFGASNKIAEMGRWSGGGANDLLDDTQLGDENKSFEYGQKDGGKVQFDGSYDPTDTNGQTVLISAWENKTKLTAADNDLRLYYSATGYFGLTTGAEALVESYSLDIDKGNIGTISFTLQVSGGYLEKKA